MKIKLCAGAFLVALSAVPVWAMPKNVVILIGDGMGPEQVKAAGMYANGYAGSLSFESFPHKGEATTYAADNAVTDSAAAATAIAAGRKVNNNVVSIASPGDGSDLKTLLEFFKERGRSTGLVTTTYLTHATPACFGAHTASRNNTAEIAEDYLNQTRPDVLFGGGGNGIFISSAVAAGYAVVQDSIALAGFDTENSSMALGHFGATYLPYELDGMGAMPHLSDMALKALQVLDNDPDGLFLMIEGGLIDGAGHANDIQRNIHETLEFAEAAKAVYSWAQSHPDTLIIVTADHETGGLTVTANNGAGNYPSVSWSSVNHTAVNVPFYAYGTNAGLFGSLIDNTSFFSLATADIPAPPAALSGAVVYPNPYKPHLHHSGITFGNITADAVVKIYNIAAESITELSGTDSGGRLVWNGRNDSGNSVASGVYIAVISGAGERKLLKFAVIK